MYTQLVQISIHLKNNNKMMTKGQYLMDITGKWLCTKTFQYNGWYAVDIKDEFSRTDIEVWNANSNRKVNVEVKFRQNDHNKFPTFYVPYNKWKWLSDNQPDTLIYYAWWDKYTILTLDQVAKYPTEWCRAAKNQATLEEGMVKNFIIPVNEVALSDYSPEQNHIVDMYATKARELRANGTWSEKIDVGQNI